MQKRVLIENVLPQLEGGRFYIKRVQEEAIKVTADIFADGYDKIRAFVRFKHESEKEWSEIEMIADVNDVWTASFLPLEKGIYEYEIHAWIDSFLTWHTFFQKQESISDNVRLALEEGVEITRKLSLTGNEKSKVEIERIADLLEDESREEEAIMTVLNPAFADVVSRFPLKQFHTVSSKFKVMVERKKTLFSTWYEVFPRSTSQVVGEHGTFKDCENLLYKVKEMGFDTLYFPPIHPIGKTNRKGRNNTDKVEDDDLGSPWAIGSKYGGHKSIEPLLGTMEHFEYLILKASSIGIEIAMDIAFQCSPDHPYIESNPKWFKWRADGTITYAENSSGKCQDIVPINFETEDWENLWEELKSIFIFWIEKGITIFCVDEPHTKSFNFWEWCINDIKKEYPDIIFLAKTFARPRLMKGLSKRGYSQSHTYFTWRNNKYELMEYMKELTKTEMREYYRPNFWPSTPDVLPYELQSSNENRFIYRYALAATLSSNYGIYGPAYEHYVHQSVLGKEEYYYSEKYELKHYDWNKETRLTQIIKRVNEVRRQNPAMQTTWNITFCETGNDKIIAYFKYNDDLSNLIFVAVNMNPDGLEQGWVQIPKSVLRIGNQVDLILDDQMVFERYHWEGDSNYIALEPNKMPFHLCVVKNNQPLKPVRKSEVTGTSFLKSIMS